MVVLPSAEEGRLDFSCEQVRVKDKSPTIIQGASCQQDATALGRDAVQVNSAHNRATDVGLWREHGVRTKRYGSTVDRTGFRLVAKFEVKARLRTHACLENETVIGGGSGLLSQCGVGLGWGKRCRVVLSAGEQRR